MRKLWEFYSKALYGVAPALAIAMLAAPLFCRRGDNEQAFVGGFRLWEPDLMSRVTSDSGSTP